MIADASLCMGAYCRCFVGVLSGSRYSWDTMCGSGVLVAGEASSRSYDHVMCYQRHIW